MIEIGNEDASHDRRRRARVPVVEVSTATDIGRVRRNNEDYVKAENLPR